MKANSMSAIFDTQFQQQTPPLLVGKFNKLTTLPLRQHNFEK